MYAHKKGCKLDSALLKTSAANGGQLHVLKWLLSGKYPQEKITFAQNVAIYIHEKLDNSDDDDTSRQLFTVWQRFDYPNIQRLYEFYEDYDRFYIVTEQLSGMMHLGLLIQRSEEVVNIARQCVCASIPTCARCHMLVSYASEFLGGWHRREYSREIFQVWFTPYYNFARHTIYIRTRSAFTNP